MTAEYACVDSALIYHHTATAKNGCTDMLLVHAFGAKCDKCRLP